jgi:hypothetical protein
LGAKAPGKASRPGRRLKLRFFDYSIASKIDGSSRSHNNPLAKSTS